MSLISTSRLLFVGWTGAVAHRYGRYNFQLFKFRFQALENCNLLITSFFLLFWLLCQIFMVPLGPVMGLTIKCLIVAALSPIFARGWFHNSNPSLLRSYATTLFSLLQGSLLFRIHHIILLNSLVGVTSPENCFTKLDH